MKNIFNKTNAPYLASGALAIGTLLASGIFAVAPYIGFLAPVAALSLGLPFVIGGAVFSAAVIALSAVVIQKNGNIRRQSALLDEEAKKNAELTLKSEEKDAKISNLEKQLDENEPFYDAVDVQKEREARQEKFESRVARRKQEEANEMAELKAKGLLPDIIELTNKETETPSPKSQPIEEKASGYLDQAVNTANWLVHQAAKAMPCLAATYLPYVYYNYITTPVSASVGDVNITQPFNVPGITSPFL
ncbi:MAG: hypothetical protein PG978_001301 [Wolbachia endosymbiont of Ctenocephalides felis wCfeF]|nr:MAG: hypothetical protein PG978_001301 [Wolbachia endosymbiont of Ctenocephalides felis wCfeF]